MSRRAWAHNNRVRTAGSAAVVDAALAAGVPRVIQESVVMLCRDGGADGIDEDTPTDNYPNASGNHAAEASARRFAEEGGVGVVLRGGPHTSLAPSSRSGCGPPRGPIHVADAVAPRQQRTVEGSDGVAAPLPERT
jgi:hypothetical protein